MQMPTTPQSLEHYQNVRLNCDCGKEHYAPIKIVRIGQGVLNELPDIVNKLGFKNLFLISDQNTYAVAGKNAMALLENANIKAQIRVLSHEGFDEATVGELLIHMPADCDAMVAVGSGSINDLTRYFSFRMGRPFMTVATAPSMDGFASTGASINVEKLKTSYTTQTPLAIIGDVDILKEAPYNMIAAGLADLLGKFTCLCDWKLSTLITGEHYCHNISNLMENCVRSVLADADKAKDRDPQIIGKIMEGLVLAGIAMSLNGDSRPASGCEHHMSHYWEMMFEQAHKQAAAHGTQVGVGTVLALKLAALLRQTKPDFEKAKQAAKNYDRAQWENEIHKAYGPAAPGVIAVEDKTHKNDTDGCLERLDRIEKNWEKILELLSDLPTADTVVQLLRTLDAPYLPAQIQVDEKLLKNTFLYCKEVRARYTMLQLAWDLNLLDTLSDEVIRQSN